MHERQIIGIIGAIGSGKDTIADYLIAAHGYKKASFARRVKDVAAAVFGPPPGVRREDLPAGSSFWWDRDLLEGSTRESREWREQVDPFWGLSPRQALQKIGTEMFRTHIRDDIWVRALEKDLAAEPAQNFVITDCRFQNEIDTIRRLGGRLIYVSRGVQPEWVPRAIEAYSGVSEAVTWFEDAGIHLTVWSTYALAEQADVRLSNDGTLEELYAAVSRIMNGVTTSV
jgi:hypothetical protein